MAHCLAIPQVDDEKAFPPLPRRWEAGLHGRWLWFPAFAGVALAASPATAQEMERIVIPHQVQVVPTAQQAQEELAHIPGGAGVVTGEQWENRRATTIKDMLDYTPGLFIQPRNGAESSRLSVRGSGLARQFQGSGLLVLQDGIPINTADGGFDFQEIDPWLTEYAEVYRGANALEYGASTLGGAINLITPTAHSAPGTRMRMEAGSFGTFHAQASTGQRSGGYDAYATAVGFAQEGFRDQNTQRTGRFSGNIGWRPAPEVETRFYLGHTATQAEIPGTLFKAEVYDDPSQPKPINAERDYARDLSITRIANRTAWQSGGIRLESTLYGRFRSLENPVFTYISDDRQDFGWRGSLRRRQGAGEWLGGVNLAYGNGKESRYANADGAPGAFILQRKEEAVTTEAYLQYSHRLPYDLTLIGSGQMSYAGRSITEIAPLSEEFTRDYTGFNPRIGLLYDLTPRVQLFTNISRSFEPPMLEDLSGGNQSGFKDLGEQTATTVEFGTRGAWRAWRWDAAYYHARVDDEFIQYRFPDGTSDTINAGDTTHDGIELGAGGAAAHSLWNPQDRLDLRLAYQWNHFRLRGDPQLGGRELPGIPEHVLRAELFYAHPSGWGIGPNVEWVPEAPPIDLANSYTAQSYALLGARAHYAPEDKPYAFYLDARNLLDKTYIATYDIAPDAGGADRSSFYPGDGLAIYAGMSWRL